MAGIEDRRSFAGGLAVENRNKAARVAVVPRSDRNYSLGVTTGTVAAALAAGSAVFAMRLDPSSPVNAFIERIRIQFSTIVAFTTPVTAGRRLGVFRGSGAAAAGGASVPLACAKDSASPASQFELAEGGDMRVATTGALTATGITWEALAAREVSLVHVGAAGAFADFLLEFAAGESAPIVLQPGQVLAIRNPAAMDAAGTWAATINIDWHEGLMLAGTVADS